MASGDNPDFSETQISSENVFDGVLLHVYKDRVRLPDGTEAVREYIHHQGAVTILAFVDERSILMERQFRYPLRRHFIELPAGKIDGGEEPLACAKRELIEECGYEAKSWRHLGTMHPCIGYADERFELFLARDLTHVGHALDAGEFLEVFTLTVEEAVDWIRQGRITEPKAVYGLLWADKLVRGEWK